MFRGIPERILQRSYQVYRRRNVKQIAKIRKGPSTPLLEYGRADETKSISSLIQSNTEYVKTHIMLAESVTQQ